MAKVVHASIYLIPSSFFQFLYCFGKEQSTPHPKRESIYWWYIYIYIWPKHPWVHKQVTPTQRICHKMWKQASGAPRIKWASNHLQSPDMKKYDTQIPQWWKFNSQFKKKKLSPCFYTYQPLILIKDKFLLHMHMHTHTRACVSACAFTVCVCSCAYACVCLCAWKINSVRILDFFNAKKAVKS